MSRNRVRSYFDKPFPTEPNPEDDAPNKTQRLMDLLFDAGQWFRMPYALIRALTPNNAIILCYLINQSYRVRAHERRSGEKRKWRHWFYCTTRQMSAAVGLPARTQRRILLELRRGGFIEHDRRGVPARRYFRICWGRIAEILENDDDE